jgi:hypothetical protein
MGTTISRRVNHSTYVCICLRKNVCNLRWQVATRCPPTKSDDERGIVSLEKGPEVSGIDRVASVKVENGRERTHLHDSW